MTADRMEFSKSDADQRDESPRLARNRVRWLLSACLLGIAVLQSAGCYTVRTGNGGLVFDKLVMDYRDRVWAARAYNAQSGGAVAPWGDHYRRGYMDGYCNVCEGGDGYVPAVPPQDYWSAQYQSQQGAQCVNSWFEGYPQGAAAARRDNAGRFSDVYVSRMLDAAIQQEKTGVTLPSDVRIVNREEEDETADASVESPDSQPPLPLPNRDWSMVFPNRGDRVD